MANTIPIHFTSESFKQLTHYLFDEIKTINKQINDYNMALSSKAVAGDRQAGLDALQNISLLGLKVGKLSICLYSLEVANGRMKPSSLEKPYNLHIEVENAILIRECLTEALVEISNNLNSSMFIVQSAVQLNTTQEQSTTKYIDEIRVASAELSKFSDLLSRVETGLVNYARQVSVGLIKE